jgi:hypothetical protein
MAVVSDVTSIWATGAGISASGVGAMVAHPAAITIAADSAIVAS